MSLYLGNHSVEGRERERGREREKERERERERERDSLYSMLNGLVESDVFSAAPAGIVSLESSPDACGAYEHFILAYFRTSKHVVFPASDKVPYLDLMQPPQGLCLRLQLLEGQRSRRKSK